MPWSFLCGSGRRTQHWGTPEQSPLYYSANVESHLKVNHTVIDIEAKPRHKPNGEYPSFLQTNSEKSDICTGFTCSFWVLRAGYSVFLEELSANGCNERSISIMVNRGN
jgi:hypothetical protein